MTRGPRAGLLAVALLVAGCATVPPARPAPSDAATAAARLEALRHTEPASFRMTHQVVARFAGRTLPVSGYLLGRADGAFRVTGSAAVGPKLFDVARVGGRWESRVFVAEGAGQVDPLEIGRAVARVYFEDARGAPTWDRDHWLLTGPVEDDGADMVEVWRDGETLDLVKKRFLRGGRPVLEVAYAEPATFAGRRLARRIVLEDPRGLRIELVLTSYAPDVAAPDARLHLGAVATPE